MEKHVKVLSLFDGISCGRIALERAGFIVDKYDAFEIDKNAIKISQKNYPDIIQHGSVVDADFKQFEGYDIILAGSPCQELSKQNNNAKIGFNGTKSVLFYEFVRALKEVKPKYFLLENVASMTPENKNIITDTLGVEPIMINSELLSAQCRRRYYWTNIPNVVQPINKYIKLQDILQPLNEIDMNKYGVNKPFIIDHPDKKVCGWIQSNEFRANRQIFNPMFNMNALQCRCDRLYVYQNNTVRKITPLEAERLQTLPDNYTEGVAQTYRFHAIGNGWTVDVIKYILSFIL